MTKNEFIFSDRRKHRFARHIAFWFVWCLAYNILFHFPNHVFKGWDLTGPGTKNYQELGPVLFFIKSLIVNSFLAVIVPQIALTYFLMYWLLPKFYFKKRNIFLAVVITVFVLIIYNLLALATKHAAPLYNTIVYGDPLGWPYMGTQWAVMIDQFTSLPIILGFALIIKLLKRWWLKQKQTEQLVREKTNAELQLLKAQVHPHFLFNTLNNIYFFMLSGSSKAPDMIKKLSGLLYYILNECNRPKVALEKEIGMIEDYMALEKIRYAEQMRMTIEIEGNYKDKMIAPLLLIPFVENSFKHGASKMIAQPLVKLKMRIENNRLYFCITNNKPVGNGSETAKGNIGLKNVKKRLELLYPLTHELDIVDEAESYTVRLSIELESTNEYDKLENEVKPAGEYAMA